MGKKLTMTILLDDTWGSSSDRNVTKIIESLNREIGGFTHFQVSWDEQPWDEEHWDDDKDQD